MRVVMYTQDYVPLAVLSPTERDIERLRANAGDEQEIAMHEPMVGLSTRLHPMTVHRARVMLLVEAMEWADHQRRLILVARGLPSSAIPQGTDLLSLASDILYASLRQPMRYEPNLARQMRDAERILSQAQVSPRISLGGFENGVDYTTAAAAGAIAGGAQMIANPAAPVGNWEVRWPEVPMEPEPPAPAPARRRR